MRVSTNPQFLIGRPREKAGSIATGLLGDFQYGNDLSYECEWEASESNALTVTVAVQPAPDTSAVRDFCEKISKLGVAAVMVEEADGGIQHVTTFLFRRSPELEAEIYKIEADIIGKYPNTVLEFHTRAVPRDADGAHQLPSGCYYLLTWYAAP